MSNPRSWAVNQDKGKGLDFGEPVTAPSSSASPPTSPVQGAKLPPSRRIPVRPTDTISGSQSSSPATSISTLPSPDYLPLGHPTRSTRTHSAESLQAAYSLTSSPAPSSTQGYMLSNFVDESMTGSFKINPGPKMSPRGSPLTALQVEKQDLMMPSFRLHTARLSLLSRVASEVKQTTTRDAVEQSTIGNSAGLHRSATATPAHREALELASTTAETKACKTALRAALEEESRISTAEEDSLRTLRYADVRDRDPLMIEYRFEVANLEARLQYLGADCRRLSIVSERSEHKSLDGADAEAATKLSPSHMQSKRDLQIVRALDTTMVAAKSTAIMSSQNSMSCTDELQDLGRRFNEGRPNSSTEYSSISNAPGQVDASPKAAVNPALRANNVHLSPPQTRDGFSTRTTPNLMPGRHMDHSTQKFSNVMHSMQTTISKVEGRTEATLLQDIAISPAVGIEATAQVTGRLHSNPSSTPPLRNRVGEKRRAPSQSSSRTSIHWWRIIAILTTISIAFGSLATALYGLAATQTHEGWLHDLPTSTTTTITSDNGSSNLTISWTEDHIVSMNVTYVNNASLRPEDSIPDSASFLLDWDAEFFEPPRGTEREVIQLMPVPSFRMVLIQSMGLLGLFTIFHLLIHSCLGWLGRLWHRREDEGLYWTGRWLRRFDEAKRWIALMLAGVIIALAWASVVRALLLA